MHKYFADWYRVAGLEPKADDLPKRWAGVEECLKSLNNTRALDLARMFLGSATTSAASKEQFATVFQAADAAFPMRDNDLELRVLAGSAAAQYLETKRSAAGDTLGLAIVAGACPSLRSPVLLPDIVTITTNYLFQEGLKMRSHYDPPEIKFAKADQPLAEVKPIAAQGNVPNTVAALEKPLQNLQAGVEVVAKSANNAVSNLDQMIQSLQEQTDVLWWLFGGNSRDLSRPYSKFKKVEGCLVAGKELADLTKLLPGFVSAPAVLDKILSCTEAAGDTVPFEAVINTAAGDWKAKCLESAEPTLDDLAPIHHAFRKSTEGNTWIKAFESTSGVKVKKANPTPVDLAVQMYQERLLQRAVRE
jgi:hypothetical protein